MATHPLSFTGVMGVARKDITPPLGIYSRNWGAAKHDTADGLHRPLTLTCLTFQISKNEKPLVLIAADLGWWKSQADEWFVRGAVLDALSLDPARLMICFSHTHAGPSLFSEDAHKPGGKFIKPYLEQLREAAIRGARSARSSAIPATLTWAYGKCDLATNRDLPEGRRAPGRFVCGFNPGQPADDTLLVGRVTNAAGKILATIVNYACHPTTLAWENRLLSPDYVGAMREVVESHTNAPCLFLQGASGELAPAEQYVGDKTIADAHGRKLGFAALSALEGMLPPKTALHFTQVVESGAPLAIWKRTAIKASTQLRAEMIDVSMPLKPLPSRADIEKQWRECGDRVLKERLWRKLGVRKNVGDGRAASMPLWIWQLGEAFLIGQPNEAYSEFQQVLRKRFPSKAVAVMNVVNGHIGYLPPKKFYGKNIYAVWQTPFAKGSLELLTRTGLSTLQRILAASSETKAKRASHFTEARKRVRTIRKP